MHHVRQENLPFVGSSHEFIGAEQGNTSVSVFLFHGKPGSGPGPHRHPYDEIQFIREGRGVWTVSGKTFEAALVTSLSSRLARSTALRRLVIHHWYNSTFTSVRASSKRTCRAVDRNVAGPAALGKTQAPLCQLAQYRHLSE
jgi:hypothetical protein